MNSRDLSGHLEQICFLYKLNMEKQHLVSRLHNIWNKLPKNVRSAPNLSSFKWRMKTFLFAAEFNLVLFIHIMHCTIAVTLSLLFYSI